MSFTLSDVRTDLDNLLATAVDSATWTQGMKDEGVRQALRVYNQRGPAYEVDFVVSVTGREQDLSSIPEMIAIESVACPWSDALLMEDRSVRWRKVGPMTVRLEGVLPVAGETMRVRYRRGHKVSGLDGAVTTTVIDAHRPILSVGAAAALTGLRRRQISENPAIPLEARVALTEVGAALERQFVELIEEYAGEQHGPVWARVGL